MDLAGTSASSSFYSTYSGGLKQSCCRVRLELMEGVFRHPGGEEGGGVGGGLFVDDGDLVQARGETGHAVRDGEVYRLAAFELALAGQGDEAVHAVAGERGESDGVAAARTRLVAHSVGLVVDLHDAVGVDAEVAEDFFADRALIFELGMAVIDDVQDEIGGHRFLHRRTEG